MGSLSNTDVRLNASTRDRPRTKDNLPVQGSLGIPRYIFRDVANVAWTPFAPQNQTSLRQEWPSPARSCPSSRAGNRFRQSMFVKGIRGLLSACRPDSAAGNFKILPLADQSHFRPRRRERRHPRGRPSPHVFTGLNDFCSSWESWRSTLIIGRFPSLYLFLSAFLCLSALGQTINIMTLGGAGAGRGDAGG